MVIAVLALIGIAWLLLPLIALLRSWQTGRELRDIRRHLTRPTTPVAGGPAAPGAVPEPPPGPPIGMWDSDDCGWDPQR